jgi:hypothetical protein
MNFTTDEEYCWAGIFGAEYTARNDGNDQRSPNSAFFAEILRRTHGVHDVLAFQRALPQGVISRVEIISHTVVDASQPAQTYRPQT